MSLWQRFFTFLYIHNTEKLYDISKKLMQVDIFVLRFPEFKRRHFWNDICLSGICAVLHNPKARADFNQMWAYVGKNRMIFHFLQ